MKKLIFTLSFLVTISFTIQAQVLYSTTSQGGIGTGNIFKLQTASNTLTSVFNFDERDGANPQYSELVEASNGKLYGMTYSGGNRNYGTIFSVDPSTNAYSKVYDFDNTNGRFPYGSLTKANNGLLYGITYQGGSYGVGVIFSFNPATNSYNKVKDFNYNLDGAYPQGSLLQAADNKLYGTTQNGGSNGYGTIFSYDPSTNSFLKLHDKTATSGRYSYGHLIQAGTNGLLYGMTLDGGTYNWGTIFSFDPTNKTYSKVYDFDSTHGRYPNGGLLEVNDGKLYGTTEQGATNNDGVIFSFNPSGNSYTMLKDLDYMTGNYPFGSLIQATDGKLYGLGYYSIFSFDPSSNSITKLKDFDYTNGYGAYGSPMQASNGKLYGVTSYGGTRGNGVVFSFDLTANSFAKLHDFNVNISSNGLTPNNNPIEAYDGKLYGMTSEGGSNGMGVIYSFDPSTNTYSKLKDFDNTTGGNPSSNNLVQGSDGKLYGILSNYIFSFDLSSNSFTTLQYLNGGSYGSLLQVYDGKLYGMTSYGGSNGYGTIFSYDPSTKVYTKLQDFNGTNGNYPYYASLVELKGCVTPTTTAANDGPLCEGATLHLTASGAITFSWAGPNGFTSTERNPVISNVTSSAAGTYTVTGRNGACPTTEATTTVTINAKPATPVITASGPTAFSTGGSVLLTSSSTTGNQWFKNGTVITGATATTYTATTAGSYTVQVTANGCISDMSNAIMVIENHSPVLSGVPDKATINVSFPYSFRATATDPDVPAQTLTLSSAGIPSGASFDNSTGLFNWTPSESQVGAHTFTISVNDGIITTTKTITITVVSPNPCSTSNVLLPSDSIGLVVYQPGNNSYIDEYLMGMPSGLDIGSQRYSGWSVDKNDVINNWTYYNVRAYLSSASNLPEHLRSDHWDQVNYILNYKQGTIQDIQDAIWYFIGGGSYPSSAEARAIIVNAQNYGEGFVPTIGQNMAVILDPKAGVMVTIIEVPVTKLGEDKQPPVPDVTTLPDIHSECSITITDKPTATDACAGTMITATTTDPLVYTTQGSFVIHWRYNDGNGNTTTQTQNVIIADVTLPTVVAPADISINNDAGQCYATISDLGMPAANDNCSYTVSNDAPQNNQYPVGTTIVTWTITDAVNHTTTATQTITVTDNEKPIVLTKNITLQLHSPATIAPIDINNGSYDNCGAVTLQVVS